MPKSKPVRRKNSTSTAAVPPPAPLGSKAWASLAANPNALPRSVAVLAQATRVLPTR